jgi:quinol monooxygenase YgiN
MKIKNIVVPAILLSLCSGNISAQGKSRIVHIAKLVFDSSQLERDKATMKEEIETSVLFKSGVNGLFTLSEKEHSTHFTILELYADTAAYTADLQTSQFLKFKKVTKDMAESPELIQATPSCSGHHNKITQQTPLLNDLL